MRSGLAATSILLAIAASGCDAAHLAPEDTGADAPAPSDAGLDAIDAPVHDGGIDAGTDTGPPDAGSDAGPPDAGTDAWLGDPEWVPLPEGPWCIQVATHPERVQLPGYVAAAFAIEGRVYVALDEGSSLDTTTAIVELDTLRVVAAFHTHWSWEDAERGCGIEAYGTNGTDLGLHVSRWPLGLGPGEAEIHRMRFDDALATTHLVGRYSRTTITDLPTPCRLALGPTLAYAVDGVSDVRVLRPDGTVSVVGGTVDGWTGPPVFTIGDDAWFLHGFLAPTSISRSAAGDGAGSVRTGTGISGLGVDGTTLAWLEAGQLMSGTWDGALHARSVRAVSGESLYAWAGGGYVTRPERDPAAPASFLVAVYRLSDGARATIDVHVEASFYSEPLVLATESAILVAPTRHFADLVRVDPGALTFR